MIELRRKRFLSSEYIVEENGKAVADLVRPRWSGRAQLTIQSRRFEMRKTGFLRHTYTLIEGGATVVEAKETGPFGSKFLFAYGGRQFQVHRETWFSSALVVEADGSDIGSVRRRGFFAGGASAQLPESLPLEVRTFLGWIAMVMWERRRRRHG